MKAVAVSVLALSLALSSPASGQWDSGQLGAGQVMPAAIKAKSRHRASRSAPVGTRARQHCASLPQYRAQYGVDDPRVRELSKLCRQAGYR